MGAVWPASSDERIRDVVRRAVGAFGRRRPSAIRDVPRKISREARDCVKHFAGACVLPDAVKTLFFALSLAAVGVSTADAQIYRPAVVNSALAGGIAGAIIGGHNHDRWGEGAAIGAAAGALLGAVVEPQAAVVYQQPPVAVVQSAPTVLMASVVPAAPVVGAPVFVQQPAQVVYVPYHEAAPSAYAYPAVSVGLGYARGPRRSAYFRPGYRRW